ncbi:MAG: potassium transporter Trk [delta proteobacterium ML8_F1]|nr:MAG: potassium transporter Trk [delta proteobacterium ML8_F1]
MKKQFVIIGCGRFGSSVAMKLSELGGEVLVVDNNENIVQRLSETVTYAVQADATDEHALKSLGIGNFDVAVVTIGGDIQASILITLMVKELGVRHIVAKAQNDLHAKVLYRIGADRVVFPERDMGIRVAKNLVSENLIDFIDLSSEYSILEIKALEKWVGKSLKELDMRAAYGINVIAIKSGLDLDVSVYPDQKIRSGDVLVVIGHNEDLEAIETRDEKK